MLTLPKLKTDLIINLDEMEDNSKNGGWWMGTQTPEDIKNCVKVTSQDKKFFKECQAMACQPK